MLCPKHWSKVQSSFGHEDVPDLEVRYQLLLKDMGKDLWYLTHLVVTEELIDTVNPNDYNGEPFRLQVAIEAQGGCPVCFAGENILESAIVKVKQKVSIQWVKSYDQS